MNAARDWFRRAAAPFFRPDVAVAPDPLAPDPRVLARGFAAAFALCASGERPVRLLAARALMRADRKRRPLRRIGEILGRRYGLIDLLPEYEMEGCK